MVIACMFIWDGRVFWRETNSDYEGGVYPKPLPSLGTALPSVAKEMPKVYPHSSLATALALTLLLWKYSAQ